MTRRIFRSLQLIVASVLLSREEAIAMTATSQSTKPASRSLSGFVPSPWMARIVEFESD